MPKEACAEKNKRTGVCRVGSAGYPDFPIFSLSSLLFSSPHVSSLVFSLVAAAGSSDVVYKVSFPRLLSVPFPVAHCHSVRSPRSTFACSPSDIVRDLSRFDTMHL